MPTRPSQGLTVSQASMPGASLRRDSKELDNMSSTAISVATADELVAATKNRSIKNILLTADVFDSPSITLTPGQVLRGVGAGTAPRVTFAAGNDGVELTADNHVERIEFATTPERRAIFNDTSVDTLGTLLLRSISTVGRVQLLARDKVQGGHVEIDGLDIVDADAREENDRPHEYGVYVLQGAFTLWNMQPQGHISANLVGIAVGRAGHPVLGSGVFVGGAGDTGGRVLVQSLRTRGVYSNGMIAAGTADQISGGVFTLHGAHADLVLNDGPVVTYGANDMALDNWGVVDRWIVKSTVTTHGTSGIGFVNFGRMGELLAEAPIETFGQGARGFNVYAGTLKHADFDRIVTHGDGAVGVQLSQPIGRLSVRRGIETFGGSGPSLVKGVVVTLSAVALSIKPGGSARLIEIDGGLKTHGRDIDPLEQHGVVEELHIKGGWSGQTGEQVGPDKNSPTESITESAADINDELAT
jgi:hypothetical protein